jgi:hypothetical protein
MCGRPLVDTRPEPATTKVAHEPERSNPAPAYTGGLFNLGAPADKARDLDYLLEDDEETKSSKGLVFLTLVALALVVGLGYLRFRNGGFPFLKSLTASSQHKPAAPAESSSPTEGNSDQPKPQESPDGPPASDAASQPSITPINPPATESANPPETTPSSPAASGPPAPEPNAAVPASEKPESAKEESPEKSAAPPAEAAPTPAPAKPKASAKPAPKPASKATDPVVVGENYLYGSKGFPQNCERGLHYVKPAADHSNPKAMITMGALYATGHCLSRDLPTAYRFFARALRLDPENAALRQNTERVWKQMTAEERKQAVRLTQ